MCLVLFSVCLEPHTHKYLNIRLLLSPIRFLLYLLFVGNNKQSGVPGSGPDGGAAVMRGPMAGRVVTQL
jgi:hypothetical protein